ncbi:MAG: VOC family protein [Alphaproteobacteria bacterium]|jgi:methylmalonyl-CoA/ethylmalonyl-CoA epimerase|nr:VOC family protein [Alphaproteobacteria bacterium]|tara:strand:+ start:113 stop:538 length:426 start_codon:yes stop_codon:yes gene_type:complete
MNTKRISHIGVLVHDADASCKLWTDSFGLTKFEDRRIEVEGIRSIFISVGGTWDEMVIEIMEPLDKSNMENALSKRLATAGEGFYHLCIEVDDVEGSGQELVERGMTVLMRDPISAEASPRWLVHPKDASGVMVESIAGRV